MRAGGLLVIACSIALLCGCGTSMPFIDASPLIATEVAADSAPGFLEDPQDPTRPLPEPVAEDLRLDADVLDTVRYQGEWYGEHLYLYDGNGTVYLVGVSVEDPSMWHAGSGVGNVPFAMESGDTTDNEWMLQYVPQGTAELPDGWTAFSPYLAWREL